MSRALFYTLIPGHASTLPPQILAVTDVSARFLRGHLLDGTPEFARARGCLGHFTSPEAARAALRKARIVHAAHRQAARPLLARLAELEKARDVDLAALFLPPTKADALAAQEKRHAA